MYGSAQGPRISRRQLLAAGAGVATTAALGSAAHATRAAADPASKNGYVDVQLLNITDLHGYLQPPAANDGGVITGAGGEKLTGILRSRPFVIPPKLTFFLAGHDGPPDRPLLYRNAVRLRDAGTDEILASASPPRNDTAQIIWHTHIRYSHTHLYLELVQPPLVS